LDSRHSFKAGYIFIVRFYKIHFKFGREIRDRLRVISSG
jgi:hypothetical protein